jgi:hypothetical protein
MIKPVWTYGIQLWGLCKAVPYTNYAAATVQNSAVHNQRAVVRLHSHATQ